MVGAPSSNRCGTCKQRKVKCDEPWANGQSTCSPCRKSNRICPGPPPRYFFVKNGRADTETGQSFSSPGSQGSLPDDVSGQKHMFVLRTKQRSGGTFHKIRLLDMSRGSQYAASSTSPGPMSVPRIISASAKEELAQKLIAALTQGDPAKNQTIHIRGMFLECLPPRLGISTALDDAASCLVSSHEAVVRGMPPSDWLNPKDYGQALRSLQKAIDDPLERLSTDTLAAVTIMWRVDTIFPIFNRDRAMVHARGLVNLVRLRGPADCDHALEFFLAQECQMAALQEAVMNFPLPKPCIFEGPEWDYIFQERNGRSDISMLYWSAIRECMRWPGMVNRTLTYQLDPDSRLDLNDIFSEVLQAARKMEQMDLEIEQLLTHPEVCVTRPSSRNDPRVPIVYYFKNTEAAPLLGYHAWYSMVVYRMLDFINSLYVSNGTSLPAKFAGVQSVMSIRADPAFIAQTGPTAFPSDSRISPKDTCQIPVLAARIRSESPSVYPEPSPYDVPSSGTSLPYYTSILTITPSILSASIAPDPTRAPHQSPFPLSVTHKVSPLLPSQDDITLPLTPSQTQYLRLRSIHLSQRVWMMYEQVRQWKPIGSLFYINGLKLSFRWAGTEEMRRWIVDAAADVEAHIPQREDWTEEKVDLWCRAVTGEAIGDD